MKSDEELYQTLAMNAYLKMEDMYEDEDLAEIAAGLAVDPGDLREYSIKLSISLSEKLGRQFFDVYISLAEMDGIRLFAFAEQTEKYEKAEDALNTFCDILTYNGDIIDEMLDKLICIRQLEEDEEEEIPAKSN